MQHVVVFTGAGISAESGLRTFRDSGGLWEEYDIRDVATPEAFERNPKLVIDFYNARRKQVMEAQPNAAHKALVKLEEKYHVQIITQNIDDLHERAGSRNVMHLHGEIKKVRSTRFPELIYELEGWEQKYDAVCERGYPLRPHVVWFGEMVPLMELAVEHVASADIFIIIGTSLEVYPAASLVHYAPAEIKKYYVDPTAAPLPGLFNINIMRETAGMAVPRLVEELLHKP
jgi:NAD-dependent deacetylase